MPMGLGTAEPLGIDRSEPEIPTGTIGAPVRIDRKATPSKSSSTVSP